MQLVKRLYTGGNPREIAYVDDQLKLLQNSPDGWQLADALIGSSDPNVRFFGALRLSGNPLPVHVIKKAENDHESAELITRKRGEAWGGLRDRLPVPRAATCDQEAHSSRHTDRSGRPLDAPGGAHD